MKALACHDHKMETYCVEVRKLEAKFDALELRQSLEGTMKRLIALPELA